MKRLFKITFILFFSYLGIFEALSVWAAVPWKFTYSYEIINPGAGVAAPGGGAAAVEEPPVRAFPIIDPLCTYEFYTGEKINFPVGFIIQKSVDVYLDRNDQANPPLKVSMDGVSVLKNFAIGEDWVKGLVELSLPTPGIRMVLIETNNKFRMPDGTEKVIHVSLGVPIKVIDPAISKKKQTVQLGHMYQHTVVKSGEVLQIPFSAFNPNGIPLTLEMSTGAQSVQFKYTKDNINIGYAAGTLYWDTKNISPESYSIELLAREDSQDEPPFSGAFTRVTIVQNGKTFLPPVLKPIYSYELKRDPPEIKTFNVVATDSLPVILTAAGKNINNGFVPGFLRLANDQGQGSLAVEIKASESVGDNYASFMAQNSAGSAVIVHVPVKTTDDVSKTAPEFSSFNDIVNVNKSFILDTPIHLSNRNGVPTLLKENISPFLLNTTPPDPPNINFTITTQDNNETIGNLHWDTKDVPKGSYDFVFTGYDNLNPPSSPLGIAMMRVNVENPVFIRGEVNNDGVIDDKDAKYILSYLFLAGEKPGCMDAADVDNSGRINITDPIYLLNFIFRKGPIPEPHVCGFDTPGDSLGCQISFSCPVLPPPVCTPNPNPCAGKNCGQADDECGTLVTCLPNSCVAPQTCGGGGTPNVCGCTPTPNLSFCDILPCGPILDNCGGEFMCPDRCTNQAVCKNHTCVVP